MGSDSTPQAKEQQTRSIPVGQSARREFDDNTSTQNALYFLIMFAVLVAVVPICVYFILSNYVFQTHRREWAALAAAVSANIVVVFFVITAMRQDKGEQQSKNTKSD